jgi:hypothetical protein
MEITVRRKTLLKGVHQVVLQNQENGREEEAMSGIYSNRGNREPACPPMATSLRVASPCTAMQPPAWCTRAPAGAPRGFALAFKSITLPYPSLFSSSARAAPAMAMAKPMLELAARHRSLASVPPQPPPAAPTISTSCRSAVSRVKVPILVLAN